MNIDWNITIILVSGIATLAIFSFLIKENSFYRFFEHLFIGIAAAFAVVFTIKNFVYPKIIIPMFGLDIVQYPDGTYSSKYSSLSLLYIFPILFGLLYYSVYSKKYAWLSKVVIGFLLGASAGIYFEGFFNQTMPQITGSFKPLVVFNNGSFDLKSSIENIIFIFTLISVSYYFFFSFKHKSKVSPMLISSGRWMLMVCFGAYFGSTVMARLALLVERLNFLLNPWWQAIINIWK